MRRCAFPFPQTDPPMCLTDGCSRCTSPAGPVDAEREIRSFAAWLFHPDVPPRRVEPVIQYALTLVAGCVPKALLLSLQHFMLFTPDDVPLLSDVAREAFRGREVPRWPDGEMGRSLPWSELSE